MNSLRRDIEQNEIVVMKNGLLIHKKLYPDEIPIKYRLFKITSGFGMLYNTMGKAIYGKYLSDNSESWEDGLNIDQIETIKWQSKNGKFGEKIK